MPRYEFEPVVRLYRSRGYKFDWDNCLKGVVRMKNRVPFSWLDSFDADKSLTVKKRVIVGDLAFVSKNYKQITSEEIRKIYQEALVLDLDDEEDFLNFISRNGLPYSDGLTYANLDTAGKPYEGIISDAIPAFGEGMDKFVDVEEMYKAAYGLWLLQKMSWIKYYLEELDKIDGDVTETTISELLINTVQVLLTYDGSVFYSSFEHRLANNHSSTGAFIDHVIKSFDFSKPGIEEQALKRCLYAEELCSYKDGKLHYLNQGRVAVELFNEHCANLLRILVMVMDIARKAGKSLIQSMFFEEKCFASDVVSKEGCNDDLIIRVARNVYHDILTEVMYNANQQQEVKADGKVHVASYLPSLIHALFFEEYYNDIGTLKVCLGCGKLFPNKLRRGLHCSTRCKDRKNQQASRSSKGNK